MIRVTIVTIVTDRGRGPAASNGSAARNDHGLPDRVGRARDRVRRDEDAGGRHLRGPGTPGHRLRRGTRGAWARARHRDPPASGPLESALLELAGIAEGRVPQFGADPATVTYGLKSRA